MQLKRTSVAVFHLENLTEITIQLLLQHMQVYQLSIWFQRSEKYKTSDWVNSLNVSDIDGDDVPELVIGCLNNTVQAVKILPTWQWNKHCDELLNILHVILYEYMWLAQQYDGFLETLWLNDKKIFAPKNANH